MFPLHTVPTARKWGETQPSSAHPAHPTLKITCLIPDAKLSKWNVAARWREMNYITPEELRQAETHTQLT